MCCAGEGEVKKPAFKKHEDRSCTDVLFLLFFIAAAAGSIAVISSAGAQGANPYKIIYGSDWKQRTCGMDSGVTDQKYAAWPQVFPWTYSFMVCVKDCSSTATDTTKISQLHTSTSFYRYCLPTGYIVNGKTINPSLTNNGAYASLTESASREMGNLFTVWPVILGMAFAGMIFSIIFVKMLRINWCVSLMVWLLIFLFAFAGFLLGYSFLQYANTAGVSANENTGAQVAGWFFIGFSAVFLLIVFFCRDRIAIAVAVMNASAAALDQNYSMFLFPVFPFVLALIYIGYWIAVALCIFSVKTYTPAVISWVDSLGQAVAGPSAIVATAGDMTTAYNTYALNSSMQNLFIYQFFHLLWVLQFINFFAYAVLAGVIADWYFSKTNPADPIHKIEGEGDGEFSNSAVSNSCCRVCRFHLGSIAFASFIIAVIQMIRAVIAYIQHQAKETGNVVLEYIACCLQCLCGCLESIVNYLSKNAIIWMAITGENFCVAGSNAFSTLAANGLRAFALIFVTDYIIIVGKLTVAFGTAGIGAIIINTAYAGQVSSLVLSVVLIGMIGYLTACLYLGMFEVAVDTVFLCYLSEGDNVQFAPQALKDVYGDLKKQTADEEAAKAAAAPAVEVAKK